MFFHKILERTRYMQYLATLCATLSITSSALHFSWASPTLPKLTSNESPIGVTLTKEEASWTASIFILGALFGAIGSGWILTQNARKTVLLYSSLFIFFPWIAVIFAKSVLTLYIARFIAGIGEGVVYNVTPIYIAEIADKDIRGRLGCMLTILGLLGTLYMLTVGPFVSYTVLAVSSSMFPIVFATVFWFMPESPYYLVKINQKDKARKNFILLSAGYVDNKFVQGQLDEIEKTVEHDMANRSTVIELLTNPEYRRSLIIMTGLKCIQHFTGTIAVEVYFQSIIKESKSNLSPEISSIIFGAIQVPAVVLTAAIIDKVGRKPLIILSVTGCAIGLTAEGLYFYLKESVDSSITDAISWLPLTALVFLVIMKIIGLGTIPYILMGELFPTNVKHIAGSLFLSFGALLSFMVLKFFQMVASNWGMYTIFWMYAGATALGLVFIIIVLPETKGYTFLEIQAKLNKNRKH